MNMVFVTEYSTLEISPLLVELVTLYICFQMSQNRCLNSLAISRGTIQLYASPYSTWNFFVLKLLIGIV